jgi:hypothetical protein
LGSDHRGARGCTELQRRRTTPSGAEKRRDVALLSYSKSRHARQFDCSNVSILRRATPSRPRGSRAQTGTRARPAWFLRRWARASRRVRHGSVLRPSRATLGRWRRPVRAAVRADIDANDGNGWALHLEDSKVLPVDAQQSAREMAAAGSFFSQRDAGLARAWGQSASSWRWKLPVPGPALRTRVRWLSVWHPALCAWPFARSTCACAPMA